MISYKQSSIENQILLELQENGSSCKCRTSLMLNIQQYMYIYGKRNSYLFIISFQIELVSYCLIWYSYKSVSCKRFVQCCKYVRLDFALLIKYNSITHKYYSVTTSTVEISSRTFLCKWCVLHPTHGYRKCRCCKTKPL